MFKPKRKHVNKSFLELLICTCCKKTYDPNEKHTTCSSCGKILFPKYDLVKIQQNISLKETIQDRRYNIWRFNEIMPVVNSQYHYTLGEGWTPLLILKNAGNKLGLKNLFLKDEGQNPTGTFKSRGLCAAISKGTELGIKNFVIPSAGNAGAALAAYAACAGAKAHVFMPEDTPKFLQNEVIAMGGNLKLVPGLITDAAQQVKRAVDQKGWFDVSTLKEPYRVEGKKTMGIEVVEQFGWRIPDIIIYPTGGGTGIVGMWKAFDELETLGIIGSERPRMVSVQSAGCAPIVKAFQERKKTTIYWENAHTIAPGLRIPQAFGDYLILNALYESHGAAITVSDSDIISAMKFLAKTEGIMLAPEAAATIKAAEKLLETKYLDPSDSIVLFGTGSGLVYPELWDCKHFTN
ncbi:MAG: threonine synthase [Candidatus Hodarchaeota archaeon]